MKKKVCILDYEAGNVRSVLNLVRSLNHDVTVSNSEKEIEAATHLILPGVGAFGAVMQKIRSNLCIPHLEEVVFADRKPFLGICVGMQVLASCGYEFGQYEGLNWIPGDVTQLEPSGNPLPHVGWNSLERQFPSGLTKEMNNCEDFYFVHSFAFRPENSAHVVATTVYGEEFVSIINRDNIYGVQFHPEKSQSAGRKLLENFLSIQ